LVIEHDGEGLGVRETSALRVVAQDRMVRRLQHMPCACGKTNPADVRLVGECEISCGGGGAACDSMSALVSFQTVCNRCRHKERLGLSFSMPRQLLAHLAGLTERA
jgi:hypothetical protein